MENEQPSYYSIITADVRYDTRLTPNEKLLYSEITALLQKSGICWATNNYFAKLYNVTKETISRWINHLYELNYISVQIVKDAVTNQIIRRSITTPQIEYIKSLPIEKNVNTPIDKIINTPIEKNVKENNTSKNNIKENIIINNNTKEKKKKEFIPPTFDEVKQYAIEKNREDLAQFFYEYYTTGKWKRSDGRPVLNWKQQFITWVNKNQNQKTNTFDYQSRNYTKKEFNNFFDDLDNIEI